MAEGKDYRACVGISDAAGVELAAVGETCERVPLSALGWLEACGAIAAVSTPVLEAPVEAQE